jgi:hypothetical protein
MSSTITGLSDTDIVTTGLGGDSPRLSADPDTTDSTDAADADGTDTSDATDAADADGTDTSDAPAADGADADGTDATDADGTDA